MRYKSILLALEAKASEGRVIAEAVELAMDEGALLEVIHVDTPGAGRAHAMMDYLPETREEDVRKLIADAGYPKIGSTVKIRIVKGAYYPAEIAKATPGFDLLVVGHQRKSRLLASLIDSTDERITDLSSCPILVVPIADI